MGIEQVEVDTKPIDIILKQFINIETIPIFISVSVVIILMIIFLYIRKMVLSKNKITDEFIQQVNFGIGIGTDVFQVKHNDPFAKWNEYWGNNFKKAGMFAKHSNSQIGLALFIILFSIYLVCAIVFKNFGIGLVPIISFLMFLNQILEGKTEKIQAIYDEQVPAFLSLLKSNIQAGEQPGPALLNAINDTDAPLRNELESAGKLIELGSITQALQELRSHTSNEVLKFLCGCIEISADVGANLEEQIETIEDMLESNRILKRKLQTAVAQNKPLAILSAVLIPGMFIFTYLSQQQMRDYWFKVPISWLMFALVILIYLGGTFATKRIIKKVAEF